jgi:mannose-6-phosphate isomerase-like protein (cupin superfamily)
MQTRPLPDSPHARSPAGAEIRFLLASDAGNMIHATVPPGQVNRATVHATVSEFWHVLSGRGEIWRRDGDAENVTDLTPGVSLDITAGTFFQYRCSGAEALRFVCVTMPSWPGDAGAPKAPTSSAISGSIAVTLSAVALIWIPMRRG